MPSVLLDLSESRAGIELRSRVEVCRSAIWRFEAAFAKSGWAQAIRQPPRAPSPGCERDNFKKFGNEVETLITINKGQKSEPGANAVLLPNPAREGLDERFRLEEESTAMGGDEGGSRAAGRTPTRSGRTVAVVVRSAACVPHRLPCLTSCPTLQPRQPHPPLDTACSAVMIGAVRLHKFI